MPENDDLQQLFDSATAHLMDNRFDEAIEAFRAVLAIDPGIPEAHNNLGLCLFHRSRFDDAVDEYRKALDIHDGFALAHANLGLALLNKGSIDEAIDALKRATALDPAIAEAYYNLGIACVKKGRMEEAVAAYDEFIRNASADYKNYIEGVEKMVKQLKEKGKDKN